MREVLRIKANCVKVDKLRVNEAKVEGAKKRRALREDNKAIKEEKIVEKKRKRAQKREEREEKNGIKKMR